MGSEKRKPVSHGVRFVQIPPQLSQQENEEVQRQWDTYGEAKRRIEEMGISDVNRPPPIKEGQLADISGTEYSELYVRWLGWATFVRQRYAEVRAMLLQLDNESKDVAARIRRDLDKSKVKMNAQAKADHVWLHPTYNPLQVELQLQQQIKDMVSTEVDAADATLKVISRQVEIRKSEFAGQQREGNMGRSYM